MADKFNPAEHDLKESLIALNRVSKTVKGGRIAKLSGGVAVVRVGAATEVEMKERKLRIPQRQFMGESEAIVAAFCPTIFALSAPFINIVFLSFRLRLPRRL